MKWIVKILIVSLLIPTIYIWFFYDNAEIEVISDNIYILNDISEYAIITPISENTFKCDITAPSNIINNLLDSGWSLTKLNMTEINLDVIFEKNGVVYRVYYESDGTLTLLAAPYEKSKEIVTYIDEKELLSREGE